MERVDDPHSVDRNQLGGIAQKIRNIDGKLIASSGIFKNSSSILGKDFDNVNLNFKPNADKLFDSANITIPTSMPTSELDINDYDLFRKSQDQTIRVNDEVNLDADFVDSYASKLKSTKESVKVIQKAPELKDADGFELVKGKNKTNNKKGVPLNKGKSVFVYKPVGRKGDNVGASSSSSKPVAVSNPFEALNKIGEDVGSMKEGSSAGLTSGSLKKPVVLGTDDDEEVENVYDETAKFMEAGVQSKISSEGASTPGSMGFNG
ncbi:hypothetical protein L1987_83371 [Smallanthus sonchifolius]|uniref:Uncharacterized protein n=1 Tax=Smallanthus sonchifolius TaxID=185202 RepID=A0ACB8YBW9_9ASTR|nr:hypothetical protein L1987_83371 [Smallanthus sonchifolius]